MKTLSLLYVALTCAVLGFGQAAVESTVITGATSAGASRAAGVGQSAAGIFDRLGKIANQASTASGGQTATAPAAAAAKKAPAPATPPASAPSRQPPVVASTTKPIDPTQNLLGLRREELVERYGDPLT